MSLKYQKEHFTIIQIDSTISLIPNSIFNQIFTLADEVYITCKGYTPHTGIEGFNLYAFRNLKLVKIQSDYSFAD